MKDWIDKIDARNQAQARYDKKNTVGFYMKLNIHSDADIIRWLQAQPSKQAAVKELIRKQLAEKSWTFSRIFFSVISLSFSIFSHLFPPKKLYFFKKVLDNCFIMCGFLQAEKKAPGRCPAQSPLCFQ